MKSALVMVVMLMAACGTSGLTSGPGGSAHDEVPCESPWGTQHPPICEAACAVEAGEDRSKPCDGAVNPMIVGVNRCYMTIAIGDGRRGCCLGVGMIANDGHPVVTAERFFECP